MRSVSAGHWKLTMANWEQSLKSILLQLHEKLLNSMLTILWLFSLWSKLERWKSLISGCLVSWSQVKKRARFEVSYLTAWNNNQPILNWIVTCDEKWLLYNNHKCPAQWLDQEEAPKHFPKPNSHQKTLMTFWWSAAGLMHYSFLNPGKTITSKKYAQQIDEIHWKLQCLHLALVKRKDPALLHDSDWPVWPHRSHNQCFESWANWATNFCLICHIANWLPLLQSSWQLFAEKMLPQPAGGRKCFPTVHWILKHRFLCYRNKQTYFFLAKMCWFLRFLFWLIKMYLSLVIMIWNSQTKTELHLHQSCKRVPEKHLFMLYWLCQSLWLCGSQSTVENSERDGNTRPPDLPLEKPICGSGSNS